MRYKINIKRLLLFGALAALAVILCRGCVYACTAPKEVPSRIDVAGADSVLRVYNDKTKSVMSLTMDQYLVGVVAAEMPASFEPEALKAQAVAARTFTASRILSKSEGGDYDVCTDSTCCQAWCSEADMKDKWGANYEAYRQKVQKAVEATSAQVITYDGEPIDALYHSTSGGYTEDSENVFSASKPYLRGVDSPGEEDAPKYRVETDFSLKEFVNKLNKSFSGAKLTTKNASAEVKVLSRFESGRVESVKVGKATATGREFRGALSLNSANFTLTFHKDTVSITTLGFGHGVGMSQLGANAMAKDGASYRDILMHYYTGVKIESFS
ncbi:MAG: stage II sporulation protein D [Bacillota bacterium]